MTAKVVVSESQALLDLFRSDHVPPKLKASTRINLIARLLEIFGQGYAEQVRVKLNGFQGDFDQIHRAYCEIQEKLKKGETVYSELGFPNTRVIIERYRYEGRSDEQFFEVLKRRSYEILPFAQKILTYPEPDLKALASIEATREKAFHQLSARLAPLDIDDEKGAEPPPPPVKLKELKPEEEMAVTKLYFSVPAFVYNGKRVYFSDLIGMWEHVKQGNRQLREKFLEKLTTRHWVKETPNQKINFLKFHESSFNEFLVQCSVDVLEKNLGFELSPSLQQKFAKFFHCESIRSDLCYFTADMPRFYDMDLSKFQRPSAFYLRSLQIFFFIVRKYGVRPEDHNTLLEMVMHRGPEWKLEDLEGFRLRSWEHKPADREDAEFAKAWEGFRAVLSSVARRDVSFSRPTKEDHLLFQDPNCWPLFSFFWKDPRRDLFIRVICPLSRDPHFSMSLPVLYRFCVNDGTSVKENLVRLYIDRYMDVFKVLDTNGIQIRDGERLYIDPPIEIENSLQILVEAPKNTGRFVERMGLYRFPPDKRYVALLRRFVFHPSEEIFDLLRDAPALGINEPGEELLWEALSVTHAPFAPDGEPPTQEACERARGIAAKLQERHQFSEAQIFFIYLEIIRLVLAGKEEVMGLVSQVVQQLEPFCPALEKKDIYFLFLYHPKMTPHQVVVLKNLRVDWAKSDHQLNRFIVDKKEFSSILGPIEAFVVPLSEACENDNVRSRFVATFRQSVLSAFFPPLQPLTDYFRITNLTVKDGIRWGEPVWNTHLGQLKFILGKASVGIYFNWAIYNDHPVLILSFFDVKRNAAFSACLPLNVSAQELEPDKKRRPFYSLLSELARQVFQEEADDNPAPDAPEKPETWIPCFVGLQQQLDTYAKDIKEGNLTKDQIDQIWDFLRRVKIAYRNLFLCSIADRLPPPFPSYEPMKVAAIGHIFPSHPRGALLPQAILQFEKHPEFYTPDADENFVDGCMNVFSKSTRRPEPLNLLLYVAPAKAIPISYHVQTADDLAGTDLSQVRPSTWNAAAPPQAQVQGTYVTLSVDNGGIKVPLRYPKEVFSNLQIFQRYFDYHNLLLKWMVYSQMFPRDKEVEIPEK